MYKKKEFKIDEKYSEHLYTGLMGLMMKYCHKKLEVFKRKKEKFSQILEIGAGVEPHISYINHSFDDYHILETSDFAINELKKSSNNFIIHKYDGVNFPFKNLKFDRIIMSHALEHIDQPEQFIERVMNCLNDNGIFSIALPTDPGLLWRFSRFFNGYIKAKSVYKISRTEYNYINATEHVNSVFNLASIIRYKYKKNVEEFYFPFRLNSLDLNFFYNVHITKN